MSLLSAAMAVHGSAAAGGEFNPLTAGHLAHAYDESSAQHSGDGTDLTSWDDLVGALDLTTGINNMPSYASSIANLNSEPGVVCASNAEAIGSGNTGTTFTQPYTTLAIFECISATDGDKLVASGSGSARHEIAFQNNNWSGYSGSYGQGSSHGTGNWFIWTVANGSSSKIRINGTTTSSLNMGTQSAKGFTIGGYLSSGFQSDVKVVWAGRGSGDLLADEATWVGDFETWADDKWSLGGWS